MVERPGAGSPAPPAPSPIDTGRIEGGRITFPNWRGEADAPAEPPPAPLPVEERVGFAVVGLGRLTLEEILPAFAASKKARAVALVSGNREKAEVVGAQYGIRPDGLFGYQDIATLAGRPDIRAVYVVTPNALHHAQVLASAAAGKHVLCEKPMATSSAEARDMVAACRAAAVKLMIAYRCRSEPFNRALVQVVREERYGAPRILEATNTQTQGPADQWRLKAEAAGGGCLPDIGLYCLNGCRAVTGEEPVEVFARIFSPPDDPRYVEIDETIAFMLRFPSGTIANCAASYGAHEARDMRVRSERGWIDLENAFAYGGQRLRIAHRAGNVETVKELRLQPADQFALQIDHFAECILQDRVPRPPGEEGVQDHLLMEALYRSAREGGPIALATDGRTRCIPAGLRCRTRAEVKSACFTGNAAGRNSLVGCNVGQPMADTDIRLTSLAHGGGCGCKLAPAVLQTSCRACRRRSASPNLLVGTETSDDAAVWRLNDSQALVATTDFFMPVVDDPFDFGRIAATNALSDVYAMGGPPILALAIVGMPIGKLAPETMREILAGGAAVCAAAGIPVAGGHSIDAPEPIYGLVVLGLVHPDEVLTNRGARAGDALILTKAIGVGVYAAAIKQERAAAYGLRGDDRLHDPAQRGRRRTRRDCRRARRDRRHRLRPAGPYAGDVPRLGLGGRDHAPRPPLLPASRPSPRSGVGTGASGATGRATARTSALPPACRSGGATCSPIRRPAAAC